MSFYRLYNILLIHYLAKNSEFLWKNQSINQLLLAKNAASVNGETCFLGPDSVAGTSTRG